MLLSVCFRQVVYVETSVCFSEVVYVVCHCFSDNNICCCLSVSVNNLMLLSVCFSEVVYVVCPFQ